MAFDLHPDSELIREGVRVNLRLMPYPKASGGVLMRELAEVADAVVILPLITLDDGTPGVVLIRNQRFAVNKTLLELPAGTMETGEDPAECADRELAEETGFKASHIEPMTAFFPSPGFCTEKLHIFRATGLTHVGQSLDDTERITPEPTPLDRAYDMIRTGEIEDAKTIATLLFHRTFEQAD